MTVVDRIEFLLMALEVTGKFKGKNFHLQKKDESFTWRSSYSWSYVYFLQCTLESYSAFGFVLYPDYLLGCSFLKTASIYFYPLVLLMLVFEPDHVCPTLNNR